MENTTTVEAPASKPVKKVVKKAAPVKAAVKKVAGKKAPAAKKADRVITKPEALRGPQVAILAILKKKPNGVTRQQITELMKAEGKSANLSEMIGSHDGTGNKYTTTLYERKFVREEVQETGRPLVFATAAGLKALEKAEKAEK